MKIRLSEQDLKIMDLIGWDILNLNKEQQKLFTEELLKLCNLNDNRNIIFEI